MMNLRSKLSSRSPLPSLFFLLFQSLFGDTAAALGAVAASTRSTLWSARVLDCPFTSDVFKLARICEEHASDFGILGVLWLGRREQRLQ